MNQKPKMKFTEKVYRFMQGRNGPDALYNFVTVVAIVLMLINLFAGSFLITLLYLSLLVYSLFRFFSKNIYKRRTENAGYLVFQNKITGFFKLCANMWKDRKTHVYKKCPHCKKMLRLPKNKGEHTVKCPCCGERFNIQVK